MIKINGKIVKNPEDVALLEKLLKIRAEKHNGDANIDPKEALDLLDWDNSNYIEGIDIDKSDVLHALYHKISVESFNRCLKIFSDSGIVLRQARNLPTDKKTLIFQLHPLYSLVCADIYKSEPYAKEVIEKAAESDPTTALMYAHKYISEPYAKGVIEKAAESCPYSAIFCIYIGSPVVHAILKSSSRPAIKTILDIYKSKYSKEEKTRASVLINEIVAKRLTIEDAVTISRNDRMYFNTLMSIKSKPNHLGRIAVIDDIRDVSLRIVAEINRLHNESDTIRFKSVRSAGSKELYTLMVYGEEEIFTSSFNGLFDHMILDIKWKGKSGEDLLKEVGYNEFRTFIKLCTGFGRLNEFLDTMDKKSQRELLVRFVSGIDKEEDPLSQAVVVSDAFSMINDPEILKVLQETIRKEYDSAKERKGEVIYGLLAGMFRRKAVIDEAWIREMSLKYGLLDLTRIKSEELFNPDGTNIQQHFFYADKDGEESFWGMMNQYRGKQGWVVEDMGNYVCIKSTTKGPRRIEIYANRPTKTGEEQGADEIAKAFSKRKIQPHVVVHRGHSYNAHKTIKRIPAGAKIVSLGSCGGYNNVATVLKRAPNAHIISTKGRGTSAVNDPLLKMLSEAILSGHDIIWPQFWKAAEQQFVKVPEFTNYVPPHRNLGAIFLKAYHKLSREH